MNNTQSDHNSSDGASPLPVQGPSEGTVSKPEQSQASKKQVDDQSIITSPATTEIAKPLPKLTRKQTEFVRQLVENPKISATEAAARAYSVEKRDTARAMAAENLTKPSIMAELAKYSGDAEFTLIEVMQQSRTEMKTADRDRVQWANTARQTADSLLDRLHGKATQRVESTSTSVNLSIDLTSTLAPEE